MNTPLTYVNRKGQAVEVAVSAHADFRFRQRWPLAFSNRKAPEDWDLEFQSFFSRASRLENLKSAERERMARYGKDTLYFRSGPFTFVVQDATIVTVELSGKDLRPLNRATPAPLPECDEVKYRIRAVILKDHQHLVNCGSFRSRKPVDEIVRDFQFLPLVIAAVTSKGYSISDMVGINLNAGDDSFLRHIPMPRKDDSHVVAQSA